MSLPADLPSPAAAPPPRLRYRLRFLPVLLTVFAVLLAGGLTFAMWQTYRGAPWTRDGTVRVYVVTLAPEVSGQVTALPVADNQYVRRGDLLMAIDKRDYEIAVRMGEANVAQAKADYDNKQAEAQRRERLTELSTTAEERQTFATAAQIAAAVYQQAQVNLDKAKLNLERTDIRAPANGWVTNLTERLGNYAATGQRALSLVDADSFWVDGYFEETKLPRIREGDPARIWLLGYKEMLEGHVDSLAHGITVGNAQPGSSGLATVNPIYTWVRLAQRVPIRVRIDRVPPGVRLVAGMTATVEVVPQPAGAAALP